MDEQQLSEMVIVDHSIEGWFLRGTEEDLDEVKRLARLGIQHETLAGIYGTPESHRLIALGEWAEKHGIPALKKIACTHITDFWEHFENNGREENIEVIETDARIARAALKAYEEKKD
jgi:hypothetical protein